MTDNVDLRKSHLIPEFMYQYLYNNKPRRFYTLTITDKEKKKKIEQKGIRERLLCASCEENFNESETYAAKTIYAKNLDNEAILKRASQSPDETTFLYEYENFDYKKFKLFEMSLLWRILVSSTYETFNVGEHLEKLRTALFNKDPLLDYQYGCMLQTVFYKKDKIAGGFILNPFPSKFNVIDVLNVLIDGFLYSFIITDKNNLPPEFSEFFLKQNGEMIIIGRLISKDKKLYDKVQIAYEYYDEVKLE